MIVGAVRSLALGDRADAILGHSTAWFVVRALIWTALIWTALIWTAVIAGGFATLVTRQFATS